MDIETAEAVETLRSDIHRVEREVVRVETSLTARIEHVETSLTARVELVETSLTVKIKQVETSLTAKMSELNEDAKRHTDVRLESMRDDIRLLAEGFASLSVEVRSLRR
jgi:phage host-nuclease inhibitor protein Gam